MVQPPPGRNAQVRREPAQALPGHLQPELRLRGLARALAGAPRRRPHLGGPRDQDLPRRQPPHEAGRLLGVADPRGAGRPPRPRLPVRGLHAAGDDGDAREGRLQPVLHLLHVAQREVGAHRVPDGAHDRRAPGVLPAELLRQHAGHPHRVPPDRRPPGLRGAARARGDPLAELRDLLRLREPRAHAGRRRAARSTSTRRSTS